MSSSPGKALKHTSRSHAKQMELLTFHQTYGQFYSNCVRRQS